jgi:hypothetical protein
MNLEEASFEAFSALADSAPAISSFVPDRGGTRQYLNEALIKEEIKSDVFLQHRKKKTLGSCKNPIANRSM